MLLLSILENPINQIDRVVINTYKGVFINRRLSPSYGMK